MCVSFLRSIMVRPYSNVTPKSYTTLLCDHADGSFSSSCILTALSNYFGSLHTYTKVWVPPGPWRSPPWGTTYCNPARYHVSSDEVFDSCPANSQFSSALSDSSVRLRWATQITTGTSGSSHDRPNPNQFTYVYIKIYNMWLLLIRKMCLLLICPTIHDNIHYICII